MLAWLLARLFFSILQQRGSFGALSCHYHGVFTTTEECRADHFAWKCRCWVYNKKLKDCPLSLYERYVNAFAERNSNGEKSREAVVRETQAAWKSVCGYYTSVELVVSTVLLHAFRVFMIYNNVAIVLCIVNMHQGVVHNRLCTTAWVVYNSLSLICID